MNGGLGHLSAHIGYNGPGEPSECGEMNEMTLPYRHRIRNLSPGGLRRSTRYLSVTEAPHNIESSPAERKHFVSLKLNAKGDYVIEYIISEQCVYCKHETLNQCWFNGGPPSAMLAQHYTEIGSTYRTCLRIYHFKIVYLLGFNK